MRVFFDTNVLASAAATRGLCADLFRAVLAADDLVTCPAVLNELKRVLARKFKVPPDDIAEFLDLLSAAADLAEPGELPSVTLKDKDDLPIVAAAVNGHADVLVTGDKEVLALKRVGNVLLLSPRGLWERLEKG